MEPKVTINSVSRYKISNKNEVNNSLVTFTFDIPVVEFSVNVLGVSHNTGIVAEYGSRTVDDMRNYTVDEMINFTVDDSRAFSNGTEIVAEIDWTELYQEGDNRVNIYGRSLDNEWTPYEK